MDTTPICSNCKKPLAQNAPQGICPECLLKAGLGSGMDIGPDSRSGSGRLHFVAPPLDEIARLFPQLEILSFIGQGGMGAVYRARQKALDRVVALKILPPDIGRDPTFAERFTREARALAKLNHPGIVTLYEFGSADGLFFFLMEFVEGVNLGQLLGGGHLSSREALAIVPQICEALQYAHDQGIVHRDIKPQNILVDRRGRVKVADFGLAKLAGGEEPAQTGKANAPEASLTEAGKVMGTPQYMAPEQRDRPTEVDHRADIYSLGVVFYQMLTGELPGKNVAPPSHKVQMDVRFDDVVLRALEKEPERRYQHASQVKTDVETIANAPAKPEPKLDAKAAKAWRRHFHVKAVCFFFGAVCFLIAALSFFTEDDNVLASLLSLVAVFGFAIAGYRYWQAAGAVHESGPQPPPTPEAERIRREVRPPAIGLLVTGILNWLALPLWFMIAFAIANEKNVQHIVPIGLMVAALSLSSFLIYAAIKMMRMEDSGTATAAAVIAALLPPGNIIGLPIGIWGLVTMARPQVRAAFKPSLDPWFMPKWAMFLAVGLLGVNGFHLGAKLLGRGPNSVLISGLAAPKFGTLTTSPSGRARDTQIDFQLQPTNEVTRSELPVVARAVTGQYKVAVSNGPVFEVLALTSTPEAGMTWWGPDGTLLKESPGDRLGDLSTFCPSGKSSVEFAVVIKANREASEEQDWLPMFDPRPQYVSRHDLFKANESVGLAALAGFRIAPTNLTCRLGLPEGDWQRVASWDKAGNLLSNESGGKLQLLRSGDESTTCMKLMHQVDPDKFAVRMAARLKSGEHRLAALCRTEYGEKDARVCALLHGMKGEEVIAYELYRIPLRWAAIPGIATKPNVPPLPPLRAGPRKFVRLVADQNSLTFEGKPTTWDNVGAMLASVTDRPRTVLEFAVTSDQITVAQQNEWSHKASALARQHGFEYASFIGIHPLGSKGTSEAPILSSSGASKTRPPLLAELLIAEVPPDFELKQENMDRNHLQDQKNVQVLSTPRLVTTAGEEARIQIASVREKHPSNPPSYGTSPEGVTIHLLPELNDEQVSFSLKLTISASPGQETQDASVRRIATQEVSANAKTPLRKPILLELGTLPDGRRRIGSIVFTRVEAGPVRAASVFPLSQKDRARALTLFNDIEDFGHEFEAAFASTNLAAARTGVRRLLHMLTNFNAVVQGTDCQFPPGLFRDVEKVDQALGQGNWEEARRLAGHNKDYAREFKRISAEMVALARQTNGAAERNGGR